MRACVQCGLSIGESASFCPVCGTIFDEDAAGATLEATQVVEGPVTHPADETAVLDSGVAPGPEAGVSESGDRWAQVVPAGPSPELVADIADQVVGSGGTDLDADMTAESGSLRAQAPPAPPPPAPSAAPPAPPPAPATAAAPPAPHPEPEAVPSATAAAAAAPEAAPPASLASDSAPPASPTCDSEPPALPASDSEPKPGARERKLAEAAVLLEAAARCEDAAVPRAAALYQEAIVVCLDAAGEEEGLGDADPSLLRGFDGLSSLLERSGLSEEALAVLNDAAELGLLNGGAPDADGRRRALEERREGLRHLLFADSSQL